MYMKLILVVFGVLLVSSCTKEEMTLYSAYAKNGTGHKIEIRPYFFGSVPPAKVITILANDTKEIANGFDRGIVGNVGFNSNYLSGSDSIIVVFDDLFKMTHYFNAPSQLAPKHYLLSSNRNIYNKDNYAFSFVDQSKYKRESTYLYSFTEQDYLDAR